MLLQSHSKVSRRSPSLSLETMVSRFLSVYFKPAKQHWAGGLGKKGAPDQFYCLRLIPTKSLWTPSEETASPKHNMHLGLKNVTQLS